MRAAIQTASGKAKEESIVELWRLSTSQPVVAWAAIRAADDLGDIP
ncbi:MAG: hypothetical protein L0Y54_03835 [Sporichthyaceae bacterium]|nr:hypothetical protein [Sporichthyaceae bacterium]